MRTQTDTLVTWGTVEAPTIPHAQGRDGQPAPATLRLSGLHKQFGAETAVDHVDLVVPQNRSSGWWSERSGEDDLGSMAVGLLRPDAGRSRVIGVEVWPDPIEAKTLMGVLPDGLSVPERLTGCGLLTCVGQLREIDSGVLPGRVQELLDVMELGSAERTLVADYPTGMRRRIGLATALCMGHSCWCWTSRSRRSTRSRRRR